MIIVSNHVMFLCTEAEPEKFTVGVLDGPFRIGSSFSIPLEFQDEFGHSTKPTNKLKPVLEARYAKIIGKSQCSV